MLSILPHESVETGSLPKDLLAPYVTAVKIAEVANSVSGCVDWPDPALSTLLVPTLQKLELQGDVFALLTGHAQELNSVRDRPAAYGNIVYPNAHLVALQLWDRLLAISWLAANSLELVPGQCCADRFDFEIFHLSVLKGNERAVRDFLMQSKWPEAQSLIAELGLEVSKAARQRLALKRVPTVDSAFRPASEFIDDKHPDLKAIRKVLKDNPGIEWRRPLSKQGKPIPNRLEVHAGHWHEYLFREKQMDPLDLPFEQVSAAVNEVEQRKVAERSRRQA